MCGKGSQGGGGAGALGWGGLAPAQQQTIQASPEAMGWYRQAMKLGQQAVSKPYQQFGTTAQDFVAQINPQQQQAIANINTASGMGQPYFGASAAGLAGAAQPITGQISSYMNPYMQQVVSPVQQALQQQQGQQLASQQAEAIRGGAFGGERAGLQRSVLRGQQELGMGQALSPLYQQGYGQALGAAQTDAARQLQAAQAMGGLGATAQQAALQGAQAQLGAGTLQQQTSQAGIDALRQQFQQQQMWPYMQAQFLGGLAGGLGPLLGQQTYQARAMTPFGGFFADGGDVDGGDDTARMGGAVTDSGDYYSGGIAPSGYARGGVSYAGSDVGDILKSQAAMYQHPEEDYAKLPTGQIQAAKGLEAPNLDTQQQQQKKGLSDITGAAKDILGIGKDIYGMFKGDSDSEESSSGSGGLGKVVKTGLSFIPGIGGLANLLPFAEGGSVDREGYYDGGDIFERGVIGAESAGRQFDRSGRTLTSPKGALGIAQIMPGTAPEAAKLAGLEYSPERLRTDAEYNKALGRAYYNEQLRKFGTPELAAAAYNAGPGAVQNALRKASATGRDVMSFLPAETQAYVPKVLGRGVTAPGGGLDQARGELMASRREIPMGDPRRRFMALDQSGATEGAKPEEGGIGGLLTTQNVVPALMGIGKGLAGMMSAKTVSPGAAFATGLGEGLAGGAESYLGTQKTLADIAKTQAETQERANLAKKVLSEIGQVEATTGLLGAETGEKILNIAGGAFKQVGPDWFVLNDKGQWVHLEQWRQEGGPLVGGAAAAAAASALAQRAGAPAPSAEPTTPGAPPSAPTPPRATQPPPMPPTTPVSILPGVVWNPENEKLAKNEFGKFTGIGAGAMKEKSDRYVSQTSQGADAAAATRPMHADVAKIISQAATQKGLNAPGIGFSATSGIVGALNRLANAGGVPGDVFGSARTQQDLSDKLNGISARLATSEAGQHALGALQSTIQTMPDLNKTPAAAAENAADNIMNNQRAMDRMSHMRKYGSISNNRFSDADTAFNSTNTAAKYNQERDALRDLILGKIPTPEGARKDVRKAAEILDKMYDPNVPATAIDKFFKDHYGLDNMSRYFR